MARYSRSALLLAAVVSALCHKGYALQCWSCSSDTDPDCDDPFNSSNKALTECEAKHNGERPICEAIVLKVNTLEVITMRSCGSVPVTGPPNASCSMKLPPHSSIERCHVCYQDGCNTATVQRTTYWATVVSVLIVFLNYLIKCHF